MSREAPRRRIARRERRLDDRRAAPDLPPWGLRDIRGRPGGRWLGAMATMAVYTFYCCRPDGTSTYFEPVELACDAEAWTAAQRLLDQHRSCDHVTAWRGERQILKRDREAAARAGHARTVRG